MTVSSAPSRLLGSSGLAWSWWIITPHLPLAARLADFSTENCLELTAAQRWTVASEMNSSTSCSPVLLRGLLSRMKTKTLARRSNIEANTPSAARSVTNLDSDWHPAKLEFAARANNKTRARRKFQAPETDFSEVLRAPFLAPKYGATFWPHLSRKRKLFSSWLLPARNLGGHFRGHDLLQVLLPDARFQLLAVLEIDRCATSLSSPADLFLD